VFDWDEILNMKGNSGPYIQYTVVRINSLLSKSDGVRDELRSLSQPDQEIVRNLIKFPEVLSFAANKYQPSYLAEYLYSISSQFNTFYDSNRILGNEREQEYLAISKATASIITRGLQILGIQVPEKM
jgi:arginyl-tRNA synthetase